MFHVLGDELSKFLLRRTFDNAPIETGLPDFPLKVAALR